MTLILFDPGRLQAFRDTNGDQRHAPSRYSISRPVEARSVESVRCACGRAWRRCAGAAVVDEGPVRGAALRPAFRCGELARDRDRAFESCGAALPSGCGSGSALDLLGCKRAAARRGVYRVVGDDDEAGPSWAAPDSHRTA